MMEKRLPLPVGTVLQGRYRIVRQFGHGGFGAVYEAIDDDINLTFALKETFYAADEELRTAFKREAKMLASLSHDAFPRISHYFTENDGCFLVMELIRGDDLDKLLSRQSAPFEQEKVLDWADQILDALEDLHSSGIVHRDIKPSNLKLTPKGKIKLLDFGIAKGTLEGETALMTTVGSMAAATLQYAPLEQVLKASQQFQMMLSVVSSDRVMEIMRQGTDAASDLYALAATLYHLLTKTLPADAPTRALAVWSGQHDRLIPAHELNPKVSREVSAVLQKALNLDRFDRYKSATDMRQALKEAVKPQPTPNFVPPATIKVTDNFVEPVKIQQPPNFVAAPLNQDLKTEVTQLRDLPKPPDRSNNSNLFYAALIGVPLLFALFAVIGLAVYFNLPSNGSKTNPQFSLSKTLSGHKYTVVSLTFAPDGKSIASSGVGDDDLIVWDSNSGEIKQKIETAELPAFSPNGKYLAYSQGKKGSRGLWVKQIDSGLSIELIKPSDVSFNSINFSPDGEYVYYVEVDNTSAAINTVYKIPMLGGSPVVVMSNPRYAKIFQDSKLFATVENFAPNKIFLRDNQSVNVKQILNGFYGEINSVSISPDGNKIAGGSGSDISFWDFTNKNPKQSLSLFLFFQEPAIDTSLDPSRILKGHSEKVLTTAFSPDGKLIASGGYDKTVKIWDAASGELLQTLTGHTGFVEWIVFSPDGKTIASASEDKTIKLWRMK